MDDSADTVSIDIHRETERVVGDRVHVVFDGGRPLRLITEPGGDWTVVAVEPFEFLLGMAGPPAMGTRLTLRRVSQSST